MLIIANHRMTKYFKYVLKASNLYLVFAFAFLLFYKLEINSFLKKNSCYIDVNKGIILNSASDPTTCAANLVREIPENLSIGITHGLSSNEAIKFLEGVAKVEHDNESTLIRLGELLWDNNQRARAIEIWQSIPDSDEYLADKSVYEAQNGNLEMSLLWARTAQSIDPTINGGKEEMYSTLCDSLRSSRQAEMALEWCLMSSQVLHNGWRQIALANVYYDLGLFTDAITLLKEELQSPTSEHIKDIIYHKLGQSYFRLGMFELAENASRQAIENGLMEKAVYENLVKALIQQNNIEEACFIAKEAQEYQISLDFSPDKSYLVTCP